MKTFRFVWKKAIAWFSERIIPWCVKILSQDVKMTFFMKKIIIWLFTYIRYSGCSEYLSQCIKMSIKWGILRYFENIKMRCENLKILAEKVKNSLFSESLACSSVFLKFDEKTFAKWKKCVFSLFRLVNESVFWKKYRKNTL